MCRKFGLPDEAARKLIDEGASLDKARVVVMDHLATVGLDPKVPDVGGRATLITDEKDKFRAAAEGAVLIRAGIPGDHDKILGARDLAGYSLRELARHSLILAGRPHTGSPLEMVGRALTSSDFPYILANVAHKSLFTGWETANETWREWCAVGSVSDFKTHYSPRIGEFSDLDEVGESEEYKYGARTEAQESYSVVTYGKLAAISRQAIINDDLNAITANFFGMGEAAARKVGDLPYAVLTANAAMGDAVALFDTSTHANYLSSGHGAAPGISTLAAAFLSMGTQTDLSGLRRLNIRPQFFLAPMALMGVSEIFFKSEKFSDNSTEATDSTFASTRVNPYSGEVLKRIYESRLDDDSATKWYLAAAKGKTVTVFFLNGVQAPYMEQQAGWEVDGTEFKVRIDAGAKAMDWRGLYLNYGA
jgi:phage major head subunit gpT-like protein